MKRWWLLLDVLVVAGCTAGDEALQTSAGTSTESQSVPRPPVVVPLLGHLAGVNSVAYSADGQWIASGSIDGTVRVWSAVDGTEAATLRGHTDWVRGVAFSPGGDRIASASHDGTVRLWDVANAAEEIVLRGHTQRTVSVAFNPDGSQLATASFDGTVRIWDLESRTETAILEHTSRPVSVAYSPDGSLIAVGTGTGTIVRDASSLAQVSTIGDGGFVWGLAFNKNGTQLAVSKSDEILLWDVASGEVRDTLRATFGVVAFSPDGQLLASGGFDGNIRMWDPATGLELATFSGRMGAVRSLAFSPDGVTLLAGSRDWALWQWNVRASRLAYDRGEMPYGVSIQALPVGVARDCDQGFGPGGIFEGQVTDSASAEPLDSATVIVSSGCRVHTDSQGRFEVSGVDVGDSIYVTASLTDYHPRFRWLTSRVDETTRVSVALPRQMPCDPNLHPELPRVETLDSEVVLRLPPEMAAALEDAAPGFQPLGLDAYQPGVVSGYDLDCYQAPSVVLGDLNGDGMSDLVAVGRSGDAHLHIVLISGTAGYETVERRVLPSLGLGPSPTYLSRVEAGVYRSPYEADDLVITTHAFHVIAWERASWIVFYRDGSLHDFTTSD